MSAEKQELRVHITSHWRLSSERTPETLSCFFEITGPFFAVSDIPWVFKSFLGPIIFSKVYFQQIEEKPNFQEVLKKNWHFLTKPNKYRNTKIRLSYNNILSSSKKNVWNVLTIWSFIFRFFFFPSEPSKVAFTPTYICSWMASVIVSTAMLRWLTVRFMPGSVGSFVKLTVDLMLIFLFWCYFLAFAVFLNVNYSSPIHSPDSLKIIVKIVWL